MALGSLAHGTVAKICHAQIDSRGLWRPVWHCSADARHVYQQGAVLKCHVQKVISACDGQKSHMNTFASKFFHMSLTFWFKRMVGTFWNPVFPVTRQTASPSGHGPHSCTLAILDNCFGGCDPVDVIRNAVAAVGVLSQTETKATGGLTGGTASGATGGLKQSRCWI